MLLTTKTYALLQATSVAAGVVVAKNVSPDTDMGWLFDTKMALVVLIGVPFGIMLRLGVSIEHKQTWDTIQRDLTVSLLVAATNFVVALMLAQHLHINYLEGLGLSIAIASTGLDAAKRVRSFVFKQIEAAFSAKRIQEDDTKDE